MTKKTRSQRQRAARERGDAGAPGGPGSAPRAASPAAAKKQRTVEDRMAGYRSLASPPLGWRLVMMLGLLLLSLSEALMPSTNPSAALQAAGVVGGLCVVVFVGAGMLRHYRAIYRIRRDDPGAWQPTFSFAMASLAVPLGFSGPALSPRDRLLRRITLLLVLAYAVATIMALNRKH
jgi:hypothetical protein